ncbi:hypothetical protein KPL42_03880 [Clostridium gasigenes]|uniref:hypothetical protein n=1 Tax=Clostridium gasigenes TaxID=94869 RepID=UPI001C0CC17A|nr:hypothetical protein [Clostridium gasigenes]MBU3087630.1 hypothetical protein [Clostridium gasigenes]
MNICKMKKSEKKLVMYNKKLVSNMKLCRDLLRFGVENIDFKNENTLNLVVFSISQYYYFYKEVRCLNLIKNIITNESVNIKAKIYLYWQLVRQAFINIEVKNSIRLNEIYSYILRTIEMKNSIKVPLIKEEKTKDEKIAVFITNQFLANDNSPTKVLLSIAKTINDNFKDIEKIYIFNSREMPTSIEYYYYNPLVANYIEDYSDDILNWVMLEEEINRCEIYYDQGCKDIKVIKRIEEMLQSINKLNPKFIISIGGSSILSDLSNRFTNTYTIAISGELPISQGKYLVNTGEVNSITKTKINEYQYSLEIPISMSDIMKSDNSENKYTRKELEISEDTFLISIVGNRLNAEVTKEFLKLCEDILDENKSAALIFIGSFDKESIKDKIDPKIYSKIYNISYAQNLVSAIELSNLYLNPIRFGGGLSSVVAIKTNIPVISTDVGDVAIYLTDEFKVNDYIEMKVLVNKLIKEKELYEKYKDKTKEIYFKHIKSSWNGLIEYILKEEY